MQPSITPSPSARAACAMRTASRMPSALRELDVHAVRPLGADGDVCKRVAVLVDVDREATSSGFSRAPRRVARGQRLLDVLDAELAELRDGLERLVERPSTRSRRPAAGASVTLAHGRTRSTSSPSRPPSLSFRRRKRGSGCARRAAPCRRDRRARSSTTSAGSPGATPSSCQTGWPQSLPHRSWSAASSAALAACSPGSSASRSPIASSAKGRRRAARGLFEERLGRRDALAVVRPAAWPRRSPDSRRRGELDPDDVDLDVRRARDRETAPPGGSVAVRWASSTRE